MKNKTEHKGILRVIERLSSSHFGNPRYLVELDGYVCRTMVDSPDGYTIQNYEGKYVSAYIGTHYGLSTIKDIRPIKQSTGRERLEGREKNEVAYKKKR